MCTQQSNAIYMYIRQVDVSEEAEVEKVWVVVIGLLLRLKRLELQQK